MSALAPHWLTARPIAHRGLHNRLIGIIENSMAAARAAIALDYAIECDVQLSLDGEAMVFHDDRLERLTRAQGRLDARAADDLSRLPYLLGEGAMPTLPAFLDEIAGRTPLVIEIKSHFDGDMRLAERTATLAQEYQGPVALKSFDPAVIAHLRGQRCGLPLGVVAEAHYDPGEWSFLGADVCRDLAALSHFSETRPDFLSYCVDDLPHAAATLCRVGLKMPVMTWTVRTPEQRHVAARYADQMVFEGFEP